MNLDISHKPNYFLFAQLLMRFIEKHPPTPPHNQLTIPLTQLEEIFQGNAAATTMNLQGILNIADEYQIETLSGDQKLIQSYHVDSEQSALVLELNPESITELAQGKPLITPDATLQQ